MTQGQVNKEELERLARIEEERLAALLKTKTDLENRIQRMPPPEGSNNRGGG